MDQAFRTDLLHEGEAELYDAVSCALDAPGAVGFIGVRIRVVGAEEFTFGLFKHAATHFWYIHMGE